MPHVRELDRAEISMRHAMRDDGIGSRQEQRSQTQLSHTLEGGLEGGGVPVPLIRTAPNSREALRAEGYR